MKKVFAIIGAILVVAAGVLYFTGVLALPEGDGE